MPTIYGVNVSEKKYKEYRRIKNNIRRTKLQLQKVLKKCRRYSNTIHRKECYEETKRKYINQLIGHYKKEYVFLRNMLVDAGVTSRTAMRARLNTIAKILFVLGA